MTKRERDSITLRENDSIEDCMFNMLRLKNEELRCLKKLKQSGVNLNSEFRNYLNESQIIHDKIKKECQPIIDKWVFLFHNVDLCGIIWKYLSFDENIFFFTKAFRDSYLLTVKKHFFKFENDYFQRLFRFSYISRRSKELGWNLNVTIGVEIIDLLDLTELNKFIKYKVKFNALREIDLEIVRFQDKDVIVKTVGGIFKLFDQFINVCGINKDMIKVYYRNGTSIKNINKKLKKDIFIKKV